MVSYLKNERRSMEPYIYGRNVQSENTPTDLPQKYVNLIPVVFAVGRR